MLFAFIPSRPTPFSYLCAVDRFCYQSVFAIDRVFGIKINRSIILVSIAANELRIDWWLWDLLFFLRRSICIRDHISSHRSKQHVIIASFFITSHTLCVLRDWHWNQEKQNDAGNNAELKKLYLSGDLTKNLYSYTAMKVFPGNHLFSLAKRDYILPLFCCLH